MKKFGLEKWRTILIVSLTLIVVFVMGVTGIVHLDDVSMGIVWIFIGLITIVLKSKLINTISLLGSYKFY